MNIDWKRLDLVLIGRIAGAVVIVGGVALSAWSALDSEVFEIDAAFRWRFFLQTSLQYIASGGLLILAAEIADRLTWRWDDDEALAEEEPASEDAGLPEGTEPL